MATSFSYEDASTPVSDSSSFSYEDAVAPAKKNKGIAGDLATDIKRGIMNIPSAATGLLDIPVAAVTGRPMVSEGWSGIGELTGFQPKKWAKEAEGEYSDARRTANQEADTAWESGTPVDVAKAYLTNPMHNIVGPIAESGPSMLAGGLGGRSLMSLGAKGVSTLAGGVGPSLPGALSRAVGSKLAPSVAAGVGEGGIMAGQAMNNLIEQGVDPRTAAGYSAATGGVGAVLGAAGGRLASRLGFIDPDTAIVGGVAAREASKAAGREAVKQAAKRIAGGGAAESFEEIPQSIAEQGFGNLAQDRPVTEGMARAGVEGGLAGFGMGAAFNAMPGAKYIESKRTPPEPETEIAGLLPAPTSTGTPSDQVLQASVDRQNAVDSAQANADRIYAERAAYEQSMAELFPYGQPRLTQDIVPLQQRIDEMLGIDQDSLNGLRKAQYRKQLEKAFNEPVGITHDENGLEIPLTMGALLDSQATAEQRAKNRVFTQYAQQQAETRAQQLADEETATTPDIPIVGPLSAAANQAVKSGITANIQAQKMIDQSATIGEKNGLTSSKTIAQEKKRTEEESGVGLHMLGTQTSASENSGYGTSADAKMNSDLSSAETLVKQRPDFFESDLGWVVMSKMLSVGKNPEVLKSVVDLIPVDVMNMLARQKLTPEMLFNNPSMLKNSVVLTNGDNPISIPVDASAAIIRAMAVAAAKNPSFFKLSHPRDLSVDDFSTNNTGVKIPVGMPSSYERSPVLGGTTAAAVGVRGPIDNRTILGNRGSTERTIDGNFSATNSGLGGLNSPVVSSGATIATEDIGASSDLGRMTRDKRATTSTLDDNHVSSPNKRNVQIVSQAAPEGQEQQPATEFVGQPVSPGVNNGDTVSAANDGLNGTTQEIRDDIAQMDARSNQGQGDQRSGSAGNTPDRQGVGSGRSADARSPVPGNAADLSVGTSGEPDGALRKVRAYPKGQAQMLSSRATRQGLPSEIYPHPTQAGMFAIRAMDSSQPENDIPAEPMQGNVSGSTPEQNPNSATKPVRRPIKPETSPIMRRDDLVGAIMRATGGRGIHSNMATTLTGDTANRVSKLRGLFTAEGQQDMDDLAMLLRENEGYDVEDGSRLAELIRDAAAGNYAKSMARTEQDKADAQEKQYRDQIRERARKYGIKTVAVKFSQMEAMVLKALEQRHAKALELLDAQSMGRFNAAVEQAMAMIPEEVVDDAMADVSRRGFKARDFWNETTRILRGMIYDAQQETNSNEQSQPAEARNAPGDGQGNSGIDGGSATDSGDQAQPGEEFSLAGQTLAEVKRQEAQRQADEEAAKREEKPKTPNVTADQVDMFNTQGSVFDQPAPKPEQPKTLPERIAATKQKKADENAERAAKFAEVRAKRKTSKESAKTLSKPAEDGKPTIKADAPDKIGDFGEKIGGARKDVWTSFKDSIKEVSDDDIANYPLSKSWPEPNYQALLDGGADPWAVAFMHAARDEVPRKPSASWKLKRWAGQVQVLREMTTDLVDGKHNKEFVQSEMRSGQLSKLASRIELYELVGHEKSLAGISFAEHHYSLYKGRENVNLWAVEKDSKATAMSNWPAEIATADTKAELLDRFKAAYASLDSEKQKSKSVSFDLYIQESKFFVGKKMGRNITQLAGPFDSVKEARAYRNDNYDELISRLEKAKEIPKTRRESNEPRVGEDMRDGQDVTPQLFAESFGFKGVEFGNWVDQKKRQKDLNDAFDALMDMAAIMGIPPKALSLNGELGLAFGARGTGGIDAAAAHYERDYVAINLTKKEGAGSIGHEWFHALDNYFSRMRGKGADSMTEALDVSLSSRGSNYVLQGAVRKEMVDAFGRVMGAIRSTALRARSMKLDNKRSKEYWTTSPEMSARAFESYLISKLQDQNASNDYLANIVDAQTWKAAESLGFELDDSYPYPTAGEMPVIREAFESFFQTVETKETDKGIALFNRANDGRIQPSDKAVYGMAAEGKSATEILKFIASASRTPFNRQLAKLLQQTGINPTITVGDAKGWKFNAGDGKYAAAYNPATDTAALFRPASAERNVLHELTHAATLKALSKKGLAAIQMNALFRHVEKVGRAQGLFGDKATGYGMANVEEFVAEVFSNPKFQQALKKVSAPSGSTGLKSAWHWFIRIVRGILGMQQGQENALSRALEIGVELMRENMGAATPDSTTTRLSIAPGKASMQERPAVRAVTGSMEEPTQSENGADGKANSDNMQEKTQPERIVDIFGNGNRVQYFHDKKGTFLESQRYPSGKVKWRAGEVIDGLERWISDKEFDSKEDASKAIRGLRTSNAIKANNASKYGTIPNTWKDESRKIAKAIIDAGFAVDRFSSSTQSRSKYIYLENGVKVRLADHSLPNAYESPDVDFRYGSDIATLIDLIREQSSAGSDAIRYNIADDGAWSVSEQAKETVMRLAGRPMLDPSDPFAAENARLREQDQSMWSKAKKKLRRYLAPGGLLPQSVFAEKIKRDSEFQAVEFDVRHLIGGLERAVNADFGVQFDKLSKEQMRPITDALAGNVPDSLPEATKTAAVAMRQYIDGMSTEYLKIVQEKIDAKMLKALGSGKDSDKAQAINEIELYEKIKGNIGRYVHRSYQAFDDPKWFEKVPAMTLNASRLYLKQGYMEAGETDARASQLAEVMLHEILKNGTAYDSMESFIAESKLGAKDLSVLMRRKEVPAQIRALLGEYPDARLNFTKSATKMGRLIWNTRFLDRVRDIGMGSFFFEGKDRPANATTQIAAGGSEVYAPLNGLWTFPEIAQSFKDALGKEQMSDLYRAIVRANGLVKYGKTVLAPTTAMRNWQSAMFFSLANGHFDLTQMKKSISAFREQVSQKATGQDLKYLRHLKQLGVVYDTPYAGEMARLMEDARMEELLSSDKGDAVRWFRKANQLAQGFYTFGDDFWKIIGFENEKAGLMKAGLSLQEAEVEAAKRIRDTYPTYSMVGRGVQWLSRFPLAGTFVSFPAEIIRTSSNMLRTVAADLKSDNPKLRELGMKRAAGMAFVSAAFYALAALSMSMSGVGDDEEEAIRDLAPEWQKNSTFLFMGRDEKGNLRYFDMSFLDPYGYWKRPITAMMRNQPWEDSLASGLRGLLEPFLGADISAAAIFEAVANQKESGGKVYKEKDGAIDQAVDIADHLRKALQPGVVGNVERLVKAAGDVRKSSGQPYSMEDELVALLGWRATTIDPKTALYYRSFDFTDTLAEARKTLTDTLRDANDVSPEDIKDARERAKAKQDQAFSEMQRLVGAAEAAGMSKMQIVQTLRLSNISQTNIASLMRGATPAVTVTPQLASRAVRQAKIMRGDEFASEVSARYRQAMTD